MPQLKKPIDIANSKTWPDAFVIKANGGCSPTAPAKGQTFEFEELKAIVGGGIEQPQIAAPGVGDKWTMICNGDGVRLKLEFNADAAALIPNGKPFVFGDVLVCRAKMVD